MKNLSKKQIEQVKKIKSWEITYFHGNRKKVGVLSVDDFKMIVQKKRTREILKQYSEKVNPAKEVRELLQHAIKYKNTSYCKILIEGNRNIYYASPVYLHSDYNKTRLFPKNEQTVRLTYLFNQIFNRK